MKVQAFMKIRAMRKRFLLCAILLVTIAAAGCDDRGVTLVKIDGKITFGGVAPPKEGKIIFSPVEQSTPGVVSRPGNADFDAAGSFRVTTFSPDDGLIPGKYRATVLCFRATPTLENQRDVSYVPAGYSPELTIPGDGSSSFEILLDVPAK
jgi:hypothetical protein